jgi:hypothetical protein
MFWGINMVLRDDAYPGQPLRVMEDLWQLDIELSKENGLVLTRQLKGVYCGVPLIIFDVMICRNDAKQPNVKRT